MKYFKRILGLAAVAVCVFLVGFFVIGRRNYAGSMQQKENSIFPEDTLVMEQVIAWCDQKMLGDISYECWLSYENVKEQRKEDSDTMLSAEVALPYNDQEYKLDILYDSGIVQSIRIQRDNGQEARRLYGADKGSRVVDIHQYLNHNSLLNEEISYKLPDGLKDGNCYYDLSDEGSLGRLWTDTDGAEIYGYSGTMIWSCAGGIFRIDSSELDIAKNVLQYRFNKYVGNGHYAKENAVKFVKEAEVVHGVAGAQASIQEVYINASADSEDDEPVWYSTPQGTGEKVLDKVSTSQKEILPKHLWVLCVKENESEAAYVLFLDGDEYGKTEGLKLVKSLQFVNNNG